MNIRTIVTAEYRAGRLRLGAELGDSRVFGGDAGTPITTGEVNSLELEQAYVGYEVADGSPATRSKRASASEIYLARALRTPSIMTSTSPWCRKLRTVK